MRKLYTYFSKGKEFSGVQGRGFDTTTFKVIGVVLIFVLTLFLCSPAKGSNDVTGVNIEYYVYKLIHGDYGVSNNERNTLVNDLDFAVALVNYTNERVINFDSLNGLHNLELRKAALLELVNEANHIHKSVIYEIICFVKNHKGL